MAPDVLARRGAMVRALQYDLIHGLESLDRFPERLQRIIEDRAWEERVDNATGSVVGFPTFVEFVEAPLSEGLGTSVKRLKNVVRGTPAAESLDAALAGDGPGRRWRTEPTDVEPVLITDNVSNKTEAGHGNGQGYTLRRLRKHAPELHEQVLNGEMSAHAAAVKAGLRPPTATIRLDDPERIASVLRKKLTPDQLAELRRHLA